MIQVVQYTASYPGDMPLAVFHEAKGWLSCDNKSMRELWNVFGSTASPNLVTNLKLGVYYTISA